MTGDMGVLVTDYLFYRKLRNYQTTAEAKVIHICAFESKTIYLWGKNNTHKNSTMHSDPINSYS